VLTSYLGWSWIFFINVPVGLAVVALSPAFLAESRSELPHRHFDFAGAASVTAGLMLLVYALTGATRDGWGSATTIGLLVLSGALLAAFVGIELRSTAPLLPLRIFRLRSVSAANTIGLAVAAVGFSQFFLLTLYMQQVLHYSAVQTGVAFAAITLTVVVFSNVAQALVTRLGVRTVLTSGLLVTTAAQAWLLRLPSDGHYFWDMFPAFLLTGIGLASSFIPVAIAGLSGVPAADAGVASGLINASRQIGGAIGLAAVSTIAAAYTAGSVGGEELTNGIDTAFTVLAGVALGGALVAAAFTPRRPAAVEAQPVTETLEPLEEAA
jgi:MFS family permease